MSATNRYRLDDLRRLATELTSKLGVAPARASALATHLLWFDAAGASSHGISTLPDWLDRISSKEIDPVAQGRAILERSATAVFDAQRGLGPLALATAAGIASEKARDVGVGIVRVKNVGPTGPASPLASGLAVGPFLASLSGPGPSLAMALPTREGLPVVYDSELEGSPARPPEGWLGASSRWIGALTGEDGWLIVALSIPSMEPLSSFHDRVNVSDEGRGMLGPSTLEVRRRSARESGVSIDPAAMNRLREWAGRSSVAWPKDFGDRP